VPAQDPGALAAALEDALAHPDEARRRGDAARAEVLARRSIAAMARRHEAFYRGALGIAEEAP